MFPYICYNELTNNDKFFTNRSTVFRFPCCCQATSVVSDSVWPHRWQPTRLCRPWDSPGKNTGVGCHFFLQCVKVKLLSCVRLLATPWTAAHQTPPSIGFSRREYWSGLPLPSPNFYQMHFSWPRIPSRTPHDHMDSSWLPRHLLVVTDFFVFVLFQLNWDSHTTISIPSKCTLQF